jgi:hypothetical protein
VTADPAAGAEQLLLERHDGFTFEWGSNGATQSGSKPLKCSCEPVPRAGTEAVALHTDRGCRVVDAFAAHTIPRVGLQACCQRPRRLRQRSRCTAARAAASVLRCQRGEAAGVRCSLGRWRCGCWMWHHRCPWHHQVFVEPVARTHAHCYRALQPCIAVMTCTAAVADRCGARWNHSSQEMLGGSCMLLARGSS